MLPLSPTEGLQGVFARWAVWSCSEWRGFFIFAVSSVPVLRRDEAACRAVGQSGLGVQVQRCHVPCDRRLAHNFLLLNDMGKHPKSRRVQCFGQVGNEHLRDRCQDLLVLPSPHFWLLCCL